MPRLQETSWAPGRQLGSDNDLMRALHDEHAAALWRFVVGLTAGDVARAEDIVQETMLRAWRNPSVLDQTEGSARSWMFTVARRIVIDEWRSARSRREIVTDALPERLVRDETEGAVDRDLVTRALRRLSPEHREVLLECYVRDRSVAEASLKLGIPTGTIKSRTHYALRALRLAMEELGGNR